MAKKTKNSNLSLEERLEQALIPNWDEPYKLPENWCWVRIDAIASIYTGNSINERVKEEKYTGQSEGLIYLATKDIGFDSTIDYETNVRISNADGFKVAPKFSTLLCIEGGSAGRKVGFITQDVCFVNKLCAFVPHAKINPKYLYYVIQSDAFKKQFDAKKHGLIGGVSVKEVSSIFIPFAPVEIQNKIVDLVESIFNKLNEALEKAQEVVDGFEARKAAILHKAFSGELTANWRKENGVNTIGYAKRRFDEVAIIKSNLVDPAEYQDYPHIAPDNIEKKTGVLLEYHTIAEDGVKSGKHRFYPRQILYSKIRPNLSKVVVVDFDGLCSADMYPIEAIGDAKCLWYFMLSENFLEQASSAGSRSVLPKINQKELSALTVTIPDSIEEQKEIANIIDSLFAKEYQVKESAEVVIEQIDTMKKAILARAFRGELGTNDPSEESAVELLKKVLDGDVAVQTPAKKPTKRISIPSDIKELLSNIREEEIIKLLLKSAPQPVSIQKIMALSSKKFELMDALRSLEKKQLITKNESGEYSLTR